MDANFQPAKDNIASAYAVQFIYSFVHLFNQFSAFLLYLLHTRQFVKHDEKPKYDKRILSFKCMDILQENRNDM